MDSIVSFVKTKPKYPTEIPFHPGEKYPEYHFEEVSDQSNFAYDAVRQSLCALGFDRKNFGKKTWNPLGELVKPGNTVVVKPNFVRHFHGLGLGLDSLVTHGSVIRAVLDYVLIALKDKGRIIIGDSPLQAGDIHDVARVTGLPQIIDFLETKTKVEFEVIDFRKERAYKDSQGRIMRKEQLAGDPRGYAAVQLNEQSELTELDEHYQKYRVTQYNPEEMPKHHHKNHHEYLVPKSVLSADVFINLPKLKTHRKSGITASLKNLVGINGSKDWLPHHRIGSKKEGGDEYLNPGWRKSILRRLNEAIDTSSNYKKVKFLSFIRKAIMSTKDLLPMKDSYFEGSWYGNDTLPRTIVDLNKIIFFADKEGMLKKTKQRQYLSIIDGIIGGEKDGPMNPIPIESGVILSGTDPVVLDTAVARFMGFDWRKIPMIAYAYRSKGYPITTIKPEGVNIIVDQKLLDLEMFYKEYHMNFEPSSGWKGAIEKLAATDFIHR